MTTIAVGREEGPAACADTNDWPSQARGAMVAAAPPLHLM